MCGDLGAFGEGPRRRVTGPRWVEKPLERRGRRAWSVRPLPGSGPGCAGGRALGGWGWRGGCGDEGSWVFGVWGPSAPGVGGVMPWCRSRGVPGGWESWAGCKAPSRWGWGDAGQEGPLVGSCGLGRVRHPGCGEGFGFGRRTERAGPVGRRDPRQGLGAAGRARGGRRGSGEPAAGTGKVGLRGPGAGGREGASYRALCGPRGPRWTRARPRRCGGARRGVEAGNAAGARCRRAAGGGSALAPGSLHCARGPGEGSPPTLPGPRASGGHTRIPSDQPGNGVRGAWKPRSAGECGALWACGGRVRPGDLGGLPHPLPPTPARPGLVREPGPTPAVGDSVGRSSAREVWAARPLPAASAGDRYLPRGASAAPFQPLRPGEGVGWVG